MKSRLAPNPNITKDDFGLLVFLPLTPKCWNYRCVHRFGFAWWGVNPRPFHMHGKTTNSISIPKAMLWNKSLIFMMPGT